MGMIPRIQGKVKPAQGISDSIFFAGVSVDKHAVFEPAHRLFDQRKRQGDI